MDPARLLRPNPFAGDEGTIAPELMCAFETSTAGERAEAIVAALGSARVFIPVQAHAHPGRSADGGVAEHTQATDPLAQAMEIASRGLTSVPGIGMVMPVFSSANALEKWDVSARPAPVHARNAAVAAYAGAGIMALDLAGEGEFFLGRAELAAIATGLPWVAPWNDPEVCNWLTNVELPGVKTLDVCPRRKGGVEIQVRMLADAGRECAVDALETLSRYLAQAPHLVSRLSFLELTPLRS